ncbi:TadE/TadG family type IV pilus assembly protein [Flexibacterium corallicola]|uniref:TadE/TadG family type IV pilus assembly protein n=1 Tax=Flexibacterium corallicola TaxID=3037259 RepID=UPI00286FA8E7|nr:pilus assembly protein [Pseudovibrio sp. M1P-2-3]
MLVWTQIRVLSYFPKALRDTSGATAVEFGIVAIPFFMMIFAILEISMVHISGTMLDHATLETARLVRTGQAQTANMSQSEMKTQICDRMFFCSDIVRMHVEVNSFTDFGEVADGTTPVIDPETDDVKTGLPFNVGTASQVSLVRVIYEWPMRTNWMRDAFQDTEDGDRLLISTAIFRNEPFGSTGGGGNGTSSEGETKDSSGS